MGEILKFKAYNSKKSAVVTIGTFDGVHIGHQKIINHLVASAKHDELTAVILTFFPHPRMVLQKEANIKLIHTIEERSQVISKLELDYLLIKEFTQDFSCLSAEDFVKQILVDKLNTKKIIIGYDHRFGKNRAANIDDLRGFGDKFGFEVEEISAQDINEVAVSSTKIRKALENGDIETVNSYLGCPFMLTGTIIKGKGIGKQLLFPTANIHIAETYKLIPKRGAYIVESKINGKAFKGMMNIGMNPTVNGEKESVEVHFFDFEGDLYDKKLQINVLRRIRNEQKFESIEALKKQLQNDKEASLNYFANKIH